MICRAFALRGRSECCTWAVGPGYCIARLRRFVGIFQEIISLIMNFPFTLPIERSFDAVGFGLNAVDHLIVVPEYPAFDTKIRFLDHKQAAGGQTATAMVSLQRLGLRTAYAGRFGSDAEGHFGYQSIKSEGVFLGLAQIVEGARNQIAFIIIDARNGERTIIWDRDERLAYRPDEAPVTLAPLGRVCTWMRTIRRPAFVWPRPLVPKELLCLPTSTIFTTACRNFYR